MMRRRAVFLVFLIVAFIMAGCASRAPYVSETPPPEQALQTMDARRMDLDDDLDTESLLLALDRSLTYYESAGRDQIASIAGRQVDAKHMKQTLTAFRDIIRSEADLDQKKKRIADDFLLLRAAGQTGAGRSEERRVG